MLVYLIDDAPLVTSSLGTALRLETGYDVRTVTSATAALAAMPAAPPDVLITDFKMPGIDGLELLRRISRLQEHVGCLLFTGAPEYISQEGARYYTLLKPFDPERLIALVIQLARVADMKQSVSRLRAAVDSGR